VANDASQIELSPGVGGALTDAESVDTGTGTAGNTAAIQREVVVIGGLGDASGLNGRPIKLQLVLADNPGGYQLPTKDFITQQLLEALLVEARRHTVLLKYIAQGIDPRQNYSFDGPELDLLVNDSRGM